MVRAKFMVNAIAGNRISMSVVYDDSTPENKRFTKATPDGNLNMSIDNPPALEYFTVGKSYYVDFSLAS